MCILSMCDRIIILETTYEGGIKESGSQLSIEVKAPELALVNVGGELHGW